MEKKLKRRLSRRDDNTEETYGQRSYRLNRKARIQYSHDWYHKNKKLKGPRLPSPLALRIIDRLRKGEKQSDIAKKEAVSQSAVLYWRKHIGLAGPKTINPRDIVGVSVGNLKIVSYLGKPGKYHFYTCECICGKTLKVIRQSLCGNRLNKSCGCKRPSMKGARSGSFKHGKAKTSIHIRWSGMHRRCYKSSDPKFHRYGKRGIVVCERWHDFKNFYADMGEPPSTVHSLDRIDVNGNYEPGNCRWATQKTQQNNRGNNRNFTHNGITQCASAWARHYGIKPSVLRQRIDRDGLTFEEAISPVAPKLSPRP